MKPDYCTQLPSAAGGRSRLLPPRLPRLAVLALTLLLPCWRVALTFHMSLRWDSLVQMSYFNCLHLFHWREWANDFDVRCIVWQAAGPHSSAFLCRPEANVPPSSRWVCCLCSYPPVFPQPSGHIFSLSSTHFLCLSLICLMVRLPNICLPTCSLFPSLSQLQWCCDRLKYHTSPLMSFNKISCLTSFTFQKFSQLLNSFSIVPH